MRRLSPGTLILAVFAILFGLVGAYGVKKYLTQEPPPPVATPEPPKDPMLRVPVASLDLPAGRTVTEGDVMLMQMTRKAVAAAKFPPIWMDNSKQVIGRTLKQPLKQGKPFEPAAFYPEGTGPNIADSLKEGERAVTIPIKSDAADATFITPSAVVDVLFRADPDPRMDVPDATVTLLSAVRVLAVGKQYTEGAVPDKSEQQAARNQTVTLAVNQAQARALKVVEGRGTMMLALRNAKDTSTADKGGPTTLPGLLGMTKSTQPFVTEIYRRTNLSTLTFAGDRRQKIVLEPPYGLPVADDPKAAAKVDATKGNGIEVWSPGWGYPYYWGGSGGRRGGSGGTLANPGGYYGW